MLLTCRELYRNQCYINGQWRDATNGESDPVYNPATGERVGSVPRFGQAETREAIKSANAAWGAWRSTPAHKRGEILRRWANRMLDHADDLAKILTAEQGKPLSESLAEIRYAAGFLSFYAQEATRTYGDVIPSSSSDRRIIVVREPVGVCAAITPWNFPSAMITRKVGPALAAGCPIIVKPAPETPLSALALAVLAESSGVPAGIFSVITGNAQEIGLEMTANETVRKLSFTGSTAVGRLLYAQCAPTVKKLSLELGGNAPFIVFNDADLDAAVEGAMISTFRNSGQTCVSANRIYVQAGVYDEFADKLSLAIDSLVVGNGIDPGVSVGPLINDAALGKVQSHVDDAISKGAVIKKGGKAHELGGMFFEPTLITEATQEMTISHEETFGPVAPLIRFEEDNDILSLANNTEYGLAAYFYSRDIGRIWNIAENLEFGMVGINTGMISDPTAPFGGIKQSGLGREGSHYGIEEYLTLKYLCMGGI